jgi:hypothetical protein
MADRPETMKAREVVVHDRMQHGYVYYLTELEGENFDPGFRPELTPAEMLALQWAYDSRNT